VAGAADAGGSVVFPEEAFGCADFDESMPSGERFAEDVAPDFGAAPDDGAFGGWGEGEAAGVVNFGSSTALSAENESGCNDAFSVLDDERNIPKEVEREHDTGGSKAVRHGDDDGFGEFFATACNLAGADSSNGGMCAGAAVESAQEGATVDAGARRLLLERMWHESAEDFPPELITEEATAGATAASDAPTDGHDVANGALSPTRERAGGQGAEAAGADDGERTSESGRVGCSTGAAAAYLSAAPSASHEFAGKEAVAPVGGGGGGGGAVAEGGGDAVRAMEGRETLACGAGAAGPSADATESSVAAVIDAAAAAAAGGDGCVAGEEVDDPSARVLGATVDAVEGLGFGGQESGAAWLEVGETGQAESFEEGPSQVLQVPAARQGAMLDAASGGAGSFAPGAAVGGGAATAAEGEAAAGERPQVETCEGGTDAGETCESGLGASAHGRGAVRDGVGPASDAAWGKMPLEGVEAGEMALVVEDGRREGLGGGGEVVWCDEERGDGGGCREGEGADEQDASRGGAGGEVEGDVDELPEASNGSVDGLGCFDDASGVEATQPLVGPEGQGGAGLRGTAGSGAEGAGPEGSCKSWEEPSGAGDGEGSCGEAGEVVAVEAFVEGGAPGGSDVVAAEIAGQEGGGRGGRGGVARDGVLAGEGRSAAIDRDVVDGSGGRGGGVAEGLGEEAEGSDKVTEVEAGGEPRCGDGEWIDGVGGWDGEDGRGAEEGLGREEVVTADSKMLVEEDACRCGQTKADDGRLAALTAHSSAAAGCGAVEDEEEGTDGGGARSSGAHSEAGNGGGGKIAEERGEFGVGDSGAFADEPWAHGGEGDAHVSQGWAQDVGGGMKGAKGAGDALGAMPREDDEFGDGAQALHDLGNSPGGGGVEPGVFAALEGSSKEFGDGADPFDAFGTSGGAGGGDGGFVDGVDDFDAFGTRSGPEGEGGDEGFVDSDDAFGAFDEGCGVVSGAEGAGSVAAGEGGFQEGSDAFDAFGGALHRVCV